MIAVFNCSIVNVGATSSVKTSPNIIQQVYYVEMAQVGLLVIKTIGGRLKIYSNGVLMTSLS